MVTVVDDAIEQIVIGYTAEIGEQRQIWWSEPATLAATDERLYSLSIAGTGKAPPRRQAVHQLRDDDCLVDRLDG